MLLIMFILHFVAYCGAQVVQTLPGPHIKMIQKVALCTGSGAEFILPAYYAGADAYLTADIKFHEAQKMCIRDRSATMLPA